MRDYDGVDEFTGFDNHEIIVESLSDLAAGVAVGGGSVKDTAKKVSINIFESKTHLDTRNEKRSVPHFGIFWTM